MRRAVLALVLIVFVGGALVGGSSATAATGMTRVGGAPPRPAGMRVVGSVAGATRIPLTITLEPPDPGALESYATAVSTPGSIDYRDFLSVEEFRARFAPTDAQIAAVRSVLSADGLTLGAVTANGLSIKASGTAAQVSEAFSTSFDRVELAGGHTAFVNTSAPAVPSSVAATVQGVVGLNSFPVKRPSGLGLEGPTAADGPPVAQPSVITGGPEACEEGRAHPHGYTADDLASAYGFSGLYAQGDLGAGATIGLYELEPYEQSDVSAYEQCYGITPSVTNIPIDGFNETGRAGGEASGDIEDIVGLAPQAKLLVYEAQNAGASSLDNLAAMVSQLRVEVISISYGVCEALASREEVAAETVLFEEAAAQGQSVFVAAGDEGSDCPGENRGETELAVGTAGSGPFVTSVGGTQLTLGPPPTETTWNEEGFGGAGGVSRFAVMPAYQRDAAPSVGVIGADSSGVPCGAPAGEFCHEVPDVSASSASDGGYDFYFANQWTDAFGTSFAAPLWAAFVSLVNSSPACTGIGIGFVDPLLYKLAGEDYGKYFNDITTGNNDVGDVNGGLYPAGPGYDMATGLGTPIGSALSEGLCGTEREGVTMTDPGQQRVTVGTPVNLALDATNLNGAELTYTVSGLPAGLTVDAETGVITGTPTTAGTSTVTAVAEDFDGATRTVVFEWIVESPATAVVPPPTSATSAPASNGTPTPGGSPATTPTPGPRAKACTVPKLLGKSLATAKAELKGAGCELGKVAEPSRRAKGKQESLVVAAASPKPGARTTAAVFLRLAPQPAKRHH
jgi:subtilase family serine protease